MNKNKIIIWGKDNYNTLGLLRQLSGDERDVFFLLWDKPVGCASASRWFGKHIVVKSIDEGYQYLMNNFVEEKNKPVIFTPSDEIIEFVDQHKTELEKHFIVPGTREQGLLTKIDDKNTMTDLACRLGFLVPKSQICRKNSKIKNIDYPCIIKPAHTTAGHRNEFKFKVCQNEKELVSALKFVRDDSEFILQQYIPKESVALVYGARLREGAVITAGTLVKDRFIACGDGSHGLLMGSYPVGIDLLKVESFLSEIGYYGLFSFEYGIYKGKAYFFEVNLRNDGTSHYFFQAGANIPIAWYYDAIGIEINQKNTKVTGEHWFIDEIFDIANVWGGTLSRWQWKADMEKATIFKYYDKDDQEPWKQMKRGKVRKIIQDAIVKKYRLYIVWLMDIFKH